MAKKKKETFILLNVFNAFLQGLGITSTLAEAMGAQVVTKAILYKRRFTYGTFLCVGLFIYALYYKMQMLAIGSSLGLGFLMILTYDISNAGISLLCKLTNKFVEEDLKVLIYFLRPIAITSGVICVIITTTGFHYFTGIFLWLILGNAVAFIAFDRFFLRGMVFPWTAIIFMCVFVIVFFFYSKPIKARLDRADRQMNVDALNVAADVPEGRFITIPAGMILFEKLDNEVMHDLAPRDTAINAKMGRDVTIGEGLDAPSFYELRLEDKTGNFVLDEKIYYLPTDQAGNILEYQKEVKRTNGKKDDGTVINASNQLSDNTKLSENTYLGSCNDSTTVFFKSKYSFDLIVLSNGEPLTVRMQAGESHIYMLIGGNISMVGKDRDDVRIVKRIKGKIK